MRRIATTASVCSSVVKLGISTKRATKNEVTPSAANNAAITVVTFQRMFTD